MEASSRLKRGEKPAFMPHMRRRLLCVPMIVLLAACSESVDDPPDAGPRPDAAPPLDVGTAGSCPSHLRFTFLEGSRTDVGWTGLVHGTTFARDAFFRVRVFGCDTECRECRFEGPLRDSTVITQRCVSDPAVVCTSDEDCPLWECRRLDPENPMNPIRGCAHTNAICTSPEECGRGFCRFFLGPPFPIRAPRTCLGTYLDSPDGTPPIQGTIDFRTGRVVIERMRVLSGATNSEFQGACPKCVGDLRPNDGQRDGQCVESDAEDAFPYTANQACDANGLSELPEFAGFYSLDCSTPLGIRIDLSIQDGTTDGFRFQLGPEQPDCGGRRAGEPCWCGVCAGTLQPCHTAIDCGPGGSCVAPSRPSLAIAPNACLGSCNWDPATQRGTCTIPNPETDGGTLPSSCFPEGMGAEIRAPGKIEVNRTTYTIEVGHVACRAPVQSVFEGPISEEADRLVGLPGPQVSVLRFRVTPEFAP